MIRLAKIQQELQVPKSNHNDYGNYDYRSAEDILEKVKPLLEEEGLALLLTDELVLIGDRYYIKATVSLVDPKDNKVIAEAIGYAREPETKKGSDQSQITGASSSYARKYALTGLFLIGHSKDADSNEYQKQTLGNIPDVETLQANITTAGLTEKEVMDTLKHYKAEALEDLTGAQKIEFNTALKQRIKKQEQKDEVSN